MAWSFRGMNDIYPCAAGIQKANNRTWHGNVICENTGLYGLELMMTEIAA
jgi:hypothetical protein